MRTARNMNMNFNIDAFKGRFKGGYILGRYPSWDWHRIFISSVILILGMGVWGFFFFQGVEAAILTSEPASDKGLPQVKTQGDKLTALIQMYEAKVAAHQSLIDQSK